MAYGVMPYLIEWNLLQNVWGCNDKKLINVIITKKSQNILQYQELFDIDLIPYLTDIIAGTINKIEGATYWFAFELILQTKGTLLNNEFWYPTTTWHSLSSYLPDDAPFSLPEVADFPQTRIISPDSSKKLLYSLPTFSFLDEKERNQFAHWLKRAHETDRYLVLYNY